MDHPLCVVVMTLAGMSLATVWWADCRAALAGTPAPHPLPGATPASGLAITVSIVGCLVLLAIESFGEHALGISAQQSRMTWLAAVYAITAAPIIEEIIFRGWLVVEGRGPVLLWGGAVVASVAFAALHPFLWQWDDAGFAFTLTLKGWFSAGMVFAMSLWLYTARLGRWNAHRSLLPCFAGHAAKNAGVVAIKATTGFMAEPW